MQVDPVIILRVADTLYKSSIKKMPGIMNTLKAKGYTLEDIRQEICLFCMDAYPRYNPLKGTIFTFLYIHSRNRLLNLYRKMVKVPNHEDISSHSILTDHPDFDWVMSSDSCFWQDPDWYDADRGDSLLPSPPDPPAEFSEAYTEEDYDNDVKEYVKHRKQISMENYGKQVSRLDQMKIVSGVRITKSRKNQLKRKMREENLDG